MPRFAILLCSCVVACLVLFDPPQAGAAVVIDPEMTGATDVSIGTSPIQPLSNPLPDPFLVNQGGTVLIVGYNNVGALEISGGSDAFARQLWLGVFEGAIGRLSVEGAGSNFGSVIEIRVGSSGQGELDITDGGSVTSEQLYISSEDAALPSRLRINGVGSTLALQYGLFAGSDRGLSIIETTGGGQLNVPRLEVGSFSGGRGEATVSGAGSQWTVTEVLEVGRDSPGALTIAAGGEVVALGEVLLGQAAPMALAPLTLAGGVLRAGTLYAGPADIAGTGAVHANGIVADFDLTFDTTHDLEQQIALSPSVSLILDHIDATLGAGFKTQGTLTIAGGRQVHSAAGVLGYDPDSSGEALISGAGSRWTIEGDLDVGREGAGRLIIGTGASVIVGGSLNINEDTSAAESFVELAGGQLEVETLRVDPSQLRGSGTIQAGGLHVDGNLVFDDPDAPPDSILIDALPGQHVTIELDPAGIGLLGAGYRGTGSINISNGAKVHSGQGALGAEPGSHGTAAIQGTGSEWVVSDRLNLGSFGARGTLNVTNGGLVESHGLVIENGSEVAVVGSGSSLATDQLEFRSSSGAPNRFEIRDGAGVTTPDVFSSTSSSRLANVIRVTGEDSSWNLPNGAYLSSTMLSVTEGGLLNVGGDPFRRLELPNGILHIDGGLVDMNRSRLILVNGQLLFEDGVLRDFQLFEGNLTQVGGRVELSGGPSTIAGMYYLDPDATLGLTIPSMGSPNPLLTVTGAAIFDGAIEITLPDASMYTPRAGDSFLLVRSNIELTGALSEILLPELAQGLNWELERTNQELRLNIFAGDYNGDGVVDAADYTVWADTEGSVGASLAADGDADGRVDFDDYQMWKSYFGSISVATGGLAGSAAGDLSALPAVPEPSGILLLLAAAILGLLACGRENNP